MTPPNTTRLIEVFYTQKYLKEPQDTEFKRAFINMVKEFNNFEEYTNNSKAPKENKDKLLTEKRK